jgi:hypothetical protein
MNSLTSLWNFLIVRGKDSVFQLSIQLFVMSEKDITAEQIVFFIRKYEEESRIQPVIFCL